jgi:enoyl-CoA hydratase/carnithine racemase
VIVATSAAPTAPLAPPGTDVLISAAVDPPAPWVGTSDGVDAAARSIETAIETNPQAATTLVQVLRVDADLGIDARLVVESLAYSTLQAGAEHRTWLTQRSPRRTDPRSDPAVIVERRAGALSVILDRPERRNAYSAHMRDDLVAALQLAAADPSVVAVELGGVGANFCSGGDLAEFGTLSDPATAHGIRTLRSAAWWMSRLSPRLIVRLQGGCVGAGIELAAFARHVEATEDTSIALPEVGMGLIPGAGGTASIRRRIGPERMAWLALTGAALDARTAREWGLVDRIVALAQFVPGDVGSGRALPEM